MTTKRIISLLLALICLTGFVMSMSACADDTGKNKGPTGTVAPTLDHLTGLDFGGEEVTFIIAGADGDDFNQRSIHVDEDDGDAVNTAIYNRNEKINTMLNVEITIAAESNDNVTAQAKTVLLGGSSEYDIIAARQYDDIQLALDGVILDLNTLADYEADYIKWDQEYWASSYIDALTFGSHNYWLASDICLRFTGGYYCFFANSRLYNDLLEPTYGSIYDIVRNYDWTYDKLMEMSELCYEDTNGNDEVDLDGDRIGTLLTVCDNINGMAISAGVIFSRYDAEGTPSNYVTTSNKTLISFMEKCNELMYHTGVYKFGNGAVSYEEAFSHFSAGEAVFVAGRLNNAEMYLRDMEDDYYVIPCPMLNKEQGAYYTGVHDSTNIYGINYSSERIPAAAATLEAMAYESYYTIRPIYYDSFLKFKYTRDDQAAEMIDIMHDNVYTDFVFIWQFSEDMNRLGFFLRENVSSSNSSSAVKKLQNTWTEGLENILSRINEE